MLIRSHTINSLLKLHVHVLCSLFLFSFCFVFCIVHGSLNLDVVSLVIRLIVFCCHLHWVTHDSRISPFWFALYKLHNFLVNMSFVYTIGVCNKMVLTLDQCTAPLSLPTLEFLGRSVGRSNKLLCIDFTSI